MPFLGNYAAEMVVCSLEELHYRFGDDLLPQSCNLQPLLFKIFAFPFALKMYSLGILAEVNALLLIEWFKNALLLQIEEDCLLLTFFY